MLLEGKSHRSHSKRVGVALEAAGKAKIDTHCGWQRRSVPGLPSTSATPCFVTTCMKRVTGYEQAGLRRSAIPELYFSVSNRSENGKMWRSRGRKKKGY